MVGGGTVVLVEDITERKDAEARISHLARYDELTGLANRTTFHEHMEEVLGDARVEILLVMVAVLGDVTQNLVERDADPGEAVRQIENLAELPVPANEIEVLVEYGDALAHVVERGLQNLAVVVKRRIGVVEQL